MIEWLKIGTLTPSEINPRQIKTERFERLKRSLSAPDGKAFFEVRPCLVNKRGGKLVIYAGNMRCRAAIALAWPTVPCIVSEIPYEVEKERTIKDNVAQGEWDYDLLTSNFDVADLRNWGFSPEDVSFAEPEPTEEEAPKRGKLKTCPNCGTLV